MGEIATRLADRVIVTSDNPRSEDPEAIIEEILAGSGPDVEHDADRRAAIDRGDRRARGAGDVVVIAGKGHEQGQEFEGGRKIPFDDVTVAREALEGASPLASARLRVGRSLPPDPPSSLPSEHEDLDTRASRTGGRGPARRPRPPADGSRARGHRLAPGRARGAVRRPPRRARRRRPLRPAGAGRRRVGGADHAPARRGRPMRPARRADRGRGSARSHAAPGHRLAPRTGRQSDRRHRVHRQDLDQGPAAGAALAAPAHRCLARQLQHRDRACRSRSWRRRPAPRCSCSRWRCAAPARSPSWPRSPSPTSG